MHPFVEWLIGTLRRECLDRTLFWTTTDLEAKLLDFQHYYNEHPTHAGRKGHPPVTTGCGRIWFRGLKEESCRLTLGSPTLAAGLWARSESLGRPIEPRDAFIAATAEVHGLTLVTRNASDFNQQSKLL